MKALFRSQGKHCRACFFRSRWLYKTVLLFGFFLFRATDTTSKEARWLQMFIFYLLNKRYQRFHKHCVDRSCVWRVAWLTVDVIHVHWYVNSQNHGLSDGPVKWGIEIYLKTSLMFELRLSRAERHIHATIDHVILARSLSQIMKMLRFPEPFLCLDRWASVCVMNAIVSNPLYITDGRL